MKTDKWIGFNFSTDGWSTSHENHSDAWTQFVRDFRSDVKKMIKGTGWEVDRISGNYFYLSGFLYNESMNRWVYISISDVRFWQDEWHDKVLIRTAKNNKDYTGGVNQYTAFSDLVKKLDNI